MIDYILIRTTRKTVALYVRNGVAEVRAPLKTPTSEIEKFVASKEQWITKHLAQSELNAKQRGAFTLNYGDAAMFCGTEYPLLAESGMRIGFDGERFFMPPSLSPEQIKSAVVQIYRRLAKLHLTRRVAQYAGLMNVSPSVVKISGAKNRWGSCSAKKSLNFSWRLVMADEAVIDYVIVHELAHITELNHSARFWAIVASVIPDYKERQKRLKDLQRRLSAEVWE